MKQKILFCAVLIAVHSGCSDTRDSYTVTVSAGPFDRHQSIVTFTLPASFVSSPVQLLDEKGAVVALQSETEDRVRFILDLLPAGKEKTYTLESSTNRPVPADPVTFQRVASSFTFSVGGRPVFRYHSERTPLPRPDIDSIYVRGGYIHPVYSPSGILITDDYPPNHLHHHGIWAAWTNTEFQSRKPDFWNMGAGTGTVEPVSLDTTWSGPVSGGLRARQQYIDLTAAHPQTILDETWTLLLYNISGKEREHRIFDLHVSQTNVTNSPLLLPEYRYGGVGFRGHRTWDGAKNTFFLTSEGRDRSDGHATRARWCYIGGNVDGHLAGIAVLGHPGNFEAPQPMRIHPTEPFFNFAPSQAGDWSIESGQSYSANYRFIVLDGPPDAQLLDQLWNDYANPVEVTVKS